MRRLLAIALLIALGSPVVAPLLAATADPEASLPVCCRSHGTHHCAMLHGLRSAFSVPVLTAAPCSHYPATFVPLRLATASLIIEPRISSEIHRRCATLTATGQGVAPTFSAPANPKRGPPAFRA